MKTNEYIQFQIADYLSNGGLFNPEMMEHEKVRDLIIDCRDLVESQQREIEELKRDKEKLTSFINRFGDKATDVFDQMLKGQWVDDHGHYVWLNISMIELKQVIEDVLDNRQAIDARKEQPNEIEKLRQDIQNILNAEGVLSHLRHDNTRKEYLTAVRLLEGGNER